MRTLHPEIEPYWTARLKVSDLHEIHVEQCGNPDGQPVVFVHGGPGGGGDPVYRRYFDPERYRIVIFDQRGSGQSTPHAELEENTTWHLVDDMERIRTELGIDRWVVFGGSWGSTLSLAYAQKHPDRVIRQAVKGMLPKNRLARQQLRKLKVYAGAEHPHAAQMPQQMELDQPGG